MANVKQRSWSAWVARLGLTMVGLLAMAVLIDWLWLLAVASAGRADLARAVAETDAVEGRWRLEEMDRRRDELPDPENAALVVEAVGEALAAWTPAQEAEEPRGLNRRLDAGQCAVLHAELGPWEVELRQVKTLAGLPRSRSRLSVGLPERVFDYTAEHIKNVENVRRLLDADAERLSHVGRPGDVPARVRAMLHASGTLRDDLDDRAYRVRESVRRRAVERVSRLLGLGEVSDAACRELAEMMTRERDEDLFAAMFRGERAGLHRRFEQYATGDLPFESELDLSGPWPDLVALAYTCRVEQDHAFLLRRLNEVGAIARLPIRRRRDALNAFHREFDARLEDAQGGRYLLTAVLMPDFRELNRRALRDHALLCCAVAALAAERYRLANGRWPASLEALRPAFLAELPIDPDTGEALRFERQDEGVAITTTGIDPRCQPIGVRLFDPDKRGLPAEGE